MRKIAVPLIALFILFNIAGLYLVKDINLYTETDKLLQHELGALDYDKILGRLHSIPENDRVKRVQLGSISYGEHDLPVIGFSVLPSKETSEKPKLRVLLTGCVHGHEVAGGEALIRFVEYLSDRPDVYSQVAFDIVPIVNPWGWKHRTRYNGEGKDINRDFFRWETDETRLLRPLIEAEDRYDLFIDLHESKNRGYFVYQFTSRQKGYGSLFAEYLMKRKKDAESSYSEGVFAVNHGILYIPAILLRYIKMLGRSSIDHYMRLKHTKHSYTIETPLEEPLRERVRVHENGIHHMVRRLIAESGN
jgi:murein peptide amidase A